MSFKHICAYQSSLPTLWWTIASWLWLLGTPARTHTHTQPSHITVPFVRAGSFKSSLETIRLFRDLLFAKMFYCHIFLNMINLSWNPVRFMSIVFETRTNERYTELCSVVWCHAIFEYYTPHTRATQKYCVVRVHDTENGRKMCAVCFVLCIIRKTLRTEQKPYHPRLTQSLESHYLRASSV